MYVLPSVLFYALVNIALNFFFYYMHRCTHVDAATIALLIQQKELETNLTTATKQ